MNHGRPNMKCYIKHVLNQNTPCGYMKNEEKIVFHKKVDIALSVAT